MDLLKALRISTVASVIGLSVLSIPAAQAAEVGDVSALGHVSASVVGALSIKELGSINFGNFSLTGCAPCQGGGTIVMDTKGYRQATSVASHEQIGLLVGVGTSGHGDAAGIPDAASGLGTGSQAPGFYQIDSAEAGDSQASANVYISFADNTGKIIDANHPDNKVGLNGQSLTGAFTVKDFTIETDDGTTGYAVGTPDTADVYGRYIALDTGTATIRVGATLTTTAQTIVPGRYTGTFYIMASY